MIFTHQTISLQLEGIYKDLDLARSAAFESMVASNGMKAQLAEAKFQDMEKLLKSASQRITEMKREMERLKSEG
jgi:hypothetical protein